MITGRIEIDRPQAVVFAYLDELDRHTEWQGDLISSRLETEGPVRVGTRASDTRRVPGDPASSLMRSPNTTHHRSSWRVLDGPVRAVGSVIVEPVGDGARARVTVDFNLGGHGIGVLIAPFARMQARKQVPKDQAKQGDPRASAPSHGLMRAGSLGDRSRPRKPGHVQPAPAATADAEQQHSLAVVLRIGPRLERDRGRAHLKLKVNREKSVVDRATKRPLLGSASSTVGQNRTGRTSPLSGSKRREEAAEAFGLVSNAPLILCVFAISNGLQFNCFTESLDQN